MSVTSLPADEDSSSKRDTLKGRATGRAYAALAPFDEMMTDFLHAHGVPGAALAVTRKSKLLYARGFGLSDIERQRPVEPHSLFRIASVSKPITAVAVLQLVEQGKIRLDDPIFDVLPAKEWLPQRFDVRLRKITIRQLLQHTAGWDREKTFDPIARPREIAEILKKPLPVGPADVIRYTLTLPLDFDPGTRYAYYNVDYLLLGRLIEWTSGQLYEAYVKQHVLAPLGISRMQLGRAAKDDLACDEVCYYDPKRRQELAVNGRHLNAPAPIVYGGENIEAFEAHGGWIASVIDLVRFASAFDNPATSKLLKPETIRSMWARPDDEARDAAGEKPATTYYGCGWSVRPVDNHGQMNVFHSGLITGTSALLVRRHDGLNWAVLFNTHHNSDGTALSSLIDPLIHRAADAVHDWPDHDLTL